jgi:hypothetical protein
MSFSRGSSVIRRMYLGRRISKFWNTNFWNDRYGGLDTWPMNIGILGITLVF